MADAMYHNKGLGLFGMSSPQTTRGSVHIGKLFSSIEATRSTQRNAPKIRFSSNQYANDLVAVTDSLRQPTFKTSDCQTPLSLKSVQFTARALRQSNISRKVK